MRIVEESDRVQKSIERWISGFGRGKYSRILKMAKKPTADEYSKVLMITGIGIIIIGGLGFAIYYFFTVIRNFFGI